MIDIKQIVSLTDRYNFHSHTQFCDGHATMAEFAEAVVAAGFDYWGFSPHSPVPIASPCNMKSEDVATYLAEVDRLRKEYNGKVTFYAGMEIDYLGSDWGPSHPYFQELPLDYRIGSVHFIPSQDGVPVDVDGSFANFKIKMERYFHNDIRYVVDRFYDCSLEMVAAGGFDIIGHLDKIGHNASHYSPGIEDEEWYANRVNELIDAVIDSGVAAEINTKSREGHGRFFPQQRFWERLVRAGAAIPVNSDAHHIALIDASRAEALEILGKLC